MSVRYLLPLLTCCAALGAVEITDLRHDGGWIVEPGGPVGPVAITVRGEAGAALRARLELRTIGNDLVWSDERQIRLGGDGEASLRFEPDAAGRPAGDHGLRALVLPEGGGDALAARERALMLAGADDLVLIFDREPVARGLRFERTNVEPDRLSVRGADAWTWKMGYGSQQGGEGWWRSMLMTVTDERFRDGKRPIADVEVVYWHESDAPVNLKADTADGSREIATGWGRNPTWQVLRAKLPDARFATPGKTSEPKQLAAEGCDLRYNACTADGHIRSVRIHAPDASAPADWSRFLVAADFTSAAGWGVAPGGEDQVGISIANRATAAWNGTLRLELCNAEGRVQQTIDRKLRIEGGATAAETFTITPGDEIGERLLRYRLLRASQQDAGWGRSLMVADERCAWILFEREPIAHGMDFVRKQCKPVTITTAGVQRTMWEPGYGSAEQGWWRSLRMNLTDEAFTTGAAPVVDVQLRIRQPAEAPTALSVDSRSGGDVVATGWGGRGERYTQDPPTRLLRAQVDDALFARTARPEHQPNEADGCDIRYSTCNAGEIRSVLVRRYALTGDEVEWTRLLRHTGMDLGRTNYVFEPGEPLTAKVGLANRARIPYQTTASVTFSTAYDELVWKRELPVSIPAEREDALAIAIDTSDLAYGVYVLRTTLGAHVSTETLIGISDTSPVPKADEGDFYYGSGLGANWTASHSLDWADFMGLDMIRNCARGGNQLNRDDLNAAIAELKRRGLRGHLMMDPSAHADPTERAKQTAERCAFLTWAATEHGDFLHWYELGNEPDLPFFYANTIDAYIDGYVPMYDAIKAVDPSAVVMNGGLCFHGKDGWRRAHELVAKMPENKIDAWAYHGHGPGAQAERNAWERQAKALREAGKQPKMFIETESGLSANDPASWRRQAQTVVQKVVYVQSKGAPTIFYFQVHMGGGDWGYTMVERQHEPRPSVLAHRTMARLLKGLRHADELDLAATQSEAHLFAADDGRRGLVLWSDRGELTRSIAIGPGCRDLRLTDLYGNAEPLSEVTPGLVQVSFGADPVFVTWSAGDRGFAVSVPPPPLAVPDRLKVVPGRRAELPLVLRNPTDAALTTQLRVAPMGEAPVTLAGDAPAVAIPAAGQAAATVVLQVAAVTPSAWPRAWSVFIDPPQGVDLAGFDAIPSSVSKDGRSATPRIGLPEGGDLDLGKLAGGHAEKRQALCFAWLEADAAREIEIGAAADWWMEWYLNGERIYSTMDRGNQAPYSVLEHRFKGMLKRGRNLLAVRVLSGSGGWRLVSGGPDEIAAALRERSGQSDGVEVELLVGDRMLAREPIPVEILRAVDRIEGELRPSELAPEGELGHLRNLFDAVPDGSKHYQGDADLSGRVWLRHRGEQLLVAVQVRDDIAKSGDRALLRLATGVRLGEARDIAMTAQRDDAGRMTVYTASIPAAEIGKDRFALQIVVEDDDWGEPKQHMRWGAGDDPEGWYQAWLR